MVWPSVVRVKLDGVDVDEDLEELNKSQRNVCTVIVILMNFFTSAFGNNYYQYAAVLVGRIVQYKAIYNITYYFTS